MAEAKAVKFCT